MEILVSTIYWMNIHMNGLNGYTNVNDNVYEYTERIYVCDCILNEHTYKYTERIYMSEWISMWIYWMNTRVMNICMNILNEYACLNEYLYIYTAWIHMGEYILNKYTHEYTEWVPVCISCMNIHVINIYMGIRNEHTRVKEYTCVDTYWVNISMNILNEYTCLNEHLYVYTAWIYMWMNVHMNILKEYICVNIYWMNIHMFIRNEHASGLYRHSVYSYKYLCVFIHHIPTNMHVCWFIIFIDIYSNIQMPLPTRLIL